MKKGSNKLYVSNTIYIIQYPGGKRLGVSYGILNRIYKDKEYNFNHLCCTEEGSSGSPIINPINNKVIGVHKEADKIYNKGLFINYAIEDFINKNSINKLYISKTYKSKKNINKNKNNINKNNLNKDTINKNVINKADKHKNIIIVELNKNFNLNLKDNNNLENLDLSWKKISNIEKLEKIRIDNLKELYLSYNQISDIKVLEKVNFDNLKKLDLSYNKISDIKVLEKVKFENLEKLNLSNNQISDIEILEKVKFKRIRFKL